MRHKMLEQDVRRFTFVGKALAVRLVASRPEQEQKVEYN
jgi:hypothetical protein